MPKYKAKLSAIAYVVREVIIEAEDREAAWDKSDDLKFQDKTFEILDLNWALPEDVCQIETYEIEEIENGNV